MPTSVSATDFRVNFSRLLPEVMAGGTVNITKHGKTIARMMPGNVIATPNDTISATAVRVQFKSLISRLSAGETFHITKHKNVLASLTSNRIDVLTPVTPKYTENVENDDFDEEAAYNATNDAMEQLSEDMNPVTPEDAAMSDALADIEASEEYNDDVVDFEAATPVTPVVHDDHLDTLTMKQLHSYASEHNIVIPPRSRKSDVKAVIRADMADMKIDDHDWLDEEHDDEYDAFFADLAAQSGKHRQLLNTRKMHNAGTLPMSRES